MNILFALYGSAQSNSGLHVVSLARRLEQRGHQCVVVTPDGPSSPDDLDSPSVRIFSMKHWNKGVGYGGFSEKIDLVLAWTPREVVRKFVQPFCSQWQIPYIVHLEDNEDAIAAAHLGVNVSEISQYPQEVWDKHTPNSLSHPVRMREFLANAVGGTVLIEALSEFFPKGIPTHVFWPGWNEDSFLEGQPSEGPTREQLCIANDTCVIVYHGNSHVANAGDMKSLYAAIAIANRCGTPTRLIRIGSDCVDFLGDIAGVVAPFVTTIGRIQHRMIPGYLKLADVCVQPGKVDEFNEYRFPSKIPEFMICGKPVVMARTNIGRVLRHETDAYILERGDSIEIAKAICRLHAAPLLRKRLGENARQWALERLHWGHAVQGLEAFYEACTRASSSTAVADREHTAGEQGRVS